ncbi:unnamed protein product [Durusdinium trenchii]|uniref:Uncharacterized protein n=2 Tax=Durusdinium trenchii TaxID=1381693 RepID=A0ABP0LM31_9DINO
MALEWPPELCFDGLYTTFLCCGPADLVEGPCWKSPSEAKRCCHGRALSLREELVSQMERLETQWPWCGEASNYVHKRFMSQGMRPGAARQEVSEEDEAARALYRFGRLSGHPNCGPEALREDDGAVMLEAFDRLAAQVPMSRKLVNLGGGSWRDPLWDLAEHRNASGLFVDPLGPPRNETPPDAKRVRFLRSFAEPENLAELLRRGGLQVGFDRGPLPIDVLKVDVDGCDCVLAALALRLLRPKFIIMEINWSIPPPLRFVRQCHSDWSKSWAKWSSVGFRFTSHGCSLSGASAEFAPFGYSLWRLAGMVNAVWVHREVAHLLGAEVDEVNCFNHAWRSPDLVRYLHWSVIHDWRTGPVRAALAHAWGNLTCYDRVFGIDHIPFSLGV